MIGFNPLPTLARNQPLTRDFINTLYQNQMNNQWIGMQAHLADGSHNVLEVPRGVAQVNWNGATYSLQSNSASITSIAKNAVGDVTLTLSSTYFIGTNCVVALFPVDSGETALPINLNYKIVSGTSVEVFITKLAALGGNTWNAADATFSVAIYAVSRQGSSALLPPNAQGPLQALEYDEGNGRGLNRFITNEGSLYAQVTAGHTNIGKHNALEVARDACSVAIDGSNVAYFVWKTAQIGSVSRVGAGHYQITLAAGGAFATPMQMFGNVGAISVSAGGHTGAAAPGSPLTLITAFGCGAQTATSVDVYIFAFSAGTWAVADYAFTVEIHTVAVALVAGSYSKGQRTIQDAPFGFQSANTLATNEQAIQTAWIREHAASNPISGLPQPAGPGQHNVLQVPKYVGRWSIASYGLGASFYPSVTTISQIYTGLTYLSAGSYRISIQSGGSRSCMQVTAEATGTGTPFICYVRQIPTWQNNPNWWWLQFFKLSAGNWVAADPPGFSMQFFSD